MEGSSSGMRKGESEVCSAVVCALYLRGAPRVCSVARRRWPLVYGALKRHTPSLDDVSRALREEGLWEEAAALADPALLEWGLRVVGSRRALSVFMGGYPQGWLDALGSGAPPCVWSFGPVPSSPAVSVTGSRALGRSDQEFCASLGREAMRLGRTLVSGGARGADTVAMQAALESGGAGRCVVVLPSGLDCAFLEEGVCYLSVCEPWSAFTTGQAMERNALIYSYGRCAVAFRPRLRRGGTWHGAIDAVRRRLCSLWLADDRDEASRALVALGAEVLGSPRDLAFALARPAPLPQPELFGLSVVRETA